MVGKKACRSNWESGSASPGVFRVPDRKFLGKFGGAEDVGWWDETKSQQTIIVVGGLVGTEVGAGEIVRNGQRPLGRRGWYGPSPLGRQLFSGEFYGFFY